MRHLWLAGTLFAAPLLSAAAQETALDSAMTRCLSADTSTAWQKVAAAWAAETPGSWSNDSLRRELLALGEADQSQRTLLMGDSLRNPAFIQRMAAGDSVRARQLSEIISRHGWPGKSMVGARAATAAFLIVQHNAGLQQAMLALLRAQPPGEVNPADLAMLEDRVRMNAGLPQRHGTQFKPPGEATIELYPIEDPGGLEERRAAAGLPPMRVYGCFIEAQYQRKVQLPPPGDG
jgi:hypothetical protein